MNKTTLRLLLLIGLAAFIYASCSKDKDFPDIPDSFERNKKPFSVEVVPKEPVEGGSITLDRITLENSVLLVERIDLSDTLTKFHAGDSLVLTATPNNGYTFINWIRNRKEVSTKPIYGFRLDSTDIDKLNRVIYHYQARFSLDYALQVIPPIDSIIPPELIKVMGSYLYFGDNPPLLYKMRGDTILGFYAKNPTLLDYYAIDSTADFCDQYFIVDPATGNNSLPTKKSNWDYFLFHDQHRGIAQSDYKCLYVDTTWHNVPTVDGFNTIDVELRLWDLIHTNKVFIMGSDPFFTAYFEQLRTEREYYCTPGTLITVPEPPNPGSHEAVIISGKVTNSGVENVYFGIEFIEYDDPTDAGLSFANIGDILVYHYDFIPFSYWNPNN